MPLRSTIVEPWASIEYEDTDCTESITVPVSQSERRGSKRLVLPEGREQATVFSRQWLELCFNLMSGWLD